jgi:hypothetical protein
VFDDETILRFFINKVDSEYLTIYDALTLLATAEKIVE